MNIVLEVLCVMGLSVIPIFFVIKVVNGFTRQEIDRQTNNLRVRKKIAKELIRECAVLTSVDGKDGVK